MQSTEDLVQSYLANTQVYSHIRNRLKALLQALGSQNITYIPQNDLNEIMKGNHEIIRSETRTILTQFVFRPMLVLIYGEIEVEGRTFRKGEFYQCGVSSQDSEEAVWRLEINYLKATTLIVINADILEHRLLQTARSLYNANTIEKCLPTKTLKLAKSEVKKLANNLTVRQIFGKFCMVPLEPGIYLFIKGVFQILHNAHPVVEVENTFIQISNQLQFQLRLKDSEGLWGFISQSHADEIIVQQSALILERIWRDKQKLRQNVVMREKYDKECEERKKKYSIKLKKEKKTSTTVFSRQQSQEALRCSRMTMLSKCATPVTTGRSLSPSRRSKTTQSWSTRKQKQIESLDKKTQFHEKYQRTLSSSLEKLKKYREYEQLKSYSKIDSISWLRQGDLGKAKQLTFFQIKNKYPQQEATWMSNFKRVFFQANPKQIKRKDYLQQILKKRSHTSTGP